MTARLDVAFAIFAVIIGGSRRLVSGSFHGSSLASWSAGRTHQKFFLGFRAGSHHGDAPPQNARHAKPAFFRGSALMYQRDPSENNWHPSGNDLEVAWSALTKTEEWIADKLKNSALPNPYTRKEVMYVCESSENIALVVASTFRRLKEARELGELQKREEIRQFSKRGTEYELNTFRQTQVVVVPSCQDVVSSFRTFDNVLRAINRARRNVEDVANNEASERPTESSMDGDERIEWNVRVNCAYMHPDYGKMSPQEVLSEFAHKLEQNETDGKLSLHALSQNEMRKEAKRSPFPTIVIEVHATPSIKKADSEDTGEISAAVIHRLEDILRLPAAQDRQLHPTEEGESGEADLSSDSRDARIISSATGRDESALVTSMNPARDWVARNDPNYNESSSVFTVSAETTKVDDGYEFVFSHIAISSAITQRGTEISSSSRASAKREYLALPNFLTTSATRFESFSKEVTSIIGTIPALSASLDVSVLHPEHVNREFRSPVPILVLKWFEGGVQK